MAQIPVSDNTYARLNIFKAKSVVAKDGTSVTWDDVISSALDVCINHLDIFLKAVKTKVGKSRTVEVTEVVETKEELESNAEIKEKLEKGEKVTSEQLEKVNKPKTLKEKKK